MLRNCLVNDLIFIIAIDIEILIIKKKQQLFNNYLLILHYNIHTYLLLSGNL